MNNAMPIEQAEFIDNLQKWFSESTNMCHEDCYRFAFLVWQHKDYLQKVFGYQQGRTETKEELKQILHNIYVQDLYCIADMCDKDRQGYSCEDCLYNSMIRTINDIH